METAVDEEDFRAAVVEPPEVGEEGEAHLEVVEAEEQRAGPKP